MFFFHYYRQSIIFCIIFLTVICSTILSIGKVLTQWAYQYFLQILVGVDQWSGKIGSFNNRIVSNLLFCTYHFNKVYKTLLPVFCFLFVVLFCVLFWKCSNALLKFSPKQHLGKLCLEFQHELLFCSYLAILSNISHDVLQQYCSLVMQKSIQVPNLVLENASHYAIAT